LKPWRPFSVVASILCISTARFATALFSGTFTAFGPQSYTRATGDPAVVTKTFTVLSPSTTYTIRINNGGLMDRVFEKVFISVFTFNGVQVVGPNEFNQNVSVIEEAVTAAPTNELAVEVRGKPGWGVTV